MRTPAIAAAAALCLGATANAQQVSEVESTSLTDTASLRAYIDEVLPREMADLNVPGAVIAIVHDGQIALLKGYGVANKNTRAPVDPYRTVFRAGSVTKTFTAVAIMQLMEQGRLDPSRDVNTYLHDMKVPSAFGEPITASQLLTHTAGLDVTLAGTGARSADQVQPLGSYLAKNLPPRVRPPGRTIAYSNHGFTLLGHIVEQISGESYPQFMKRHVFDPLGMNSSSMEFTSDVQSRAATGYEPRGATGHRVAPVVHPNISPAASLNTTAADMAKFMIAQLEGGVYDGSRILSDSSVRLMQARHFAQDPRMPGVAWGLYESDWHGKRMLFHSGGIRGFMSAMYLWPDDRTGIFIANNGYRGDLVFVTLFNFMSRYMPAKPPPIRADPAAAPRLRRYAGFYREANQTVSTLEKAGGIRNDALEVKVSDSGTVSAFGVEFAEVRPGYFREIRGWETLAFVEDSSGKVTGVVTTYPFPGTELWNRVSFLNTTFPSQMVMMWTLFLAAGVIVRPPVIRRDSRWQRSSAPAPSEMMKWSERNVPVIRLLAAAQLAFLILMWAGSRTPGGMLYGVPWQMDTASIVSVVGAALLAIVVVRIVIALRATEWPKARVLPVAAFALSSAVFLFVQQYWNLLGIHH
jgi:CubicO group peptidase (beta-lactamase class C family)